MSRIRTVDADSPLLGIGDLIKLDQVVLHGEEVSPTLKSNIRMAQGYGVKVTADNTTGEEILSQILAEFRESLPNFEALCEIGRD